MKTKLFRVPVTVTFEVVVEDRDCLELEAAEASTTVRSLHDRIRMSAPYDRSIITGAVPGVDVKYIDYERPEEV